MWQQQLNRLKAFILQHNPYFKNGYHNAWIDPKGHVVVPILKDGEFLPVMPNDTLGDYFYLRLPQQFSLGESIAFTINDCEKGIVASGQLTLIAYVHDADPDLLIDNLLNTILQYDNQLVGVNSFITQPELVVMQELAKMDKKELMKALQNIPDNVSIVSLVFTLRTPFQYKKLSCITKPCKEC